jgi:hypothetical protein
MDDLIADYVSGTIHCAAARQHSIDLIGTAQPIDKLTVILTIKDEPPESPAPAKQSVSSHSRRKKTKLWTEYEDTRLIAGIHRYGVEAWGSIARFVGTNRSKAQCCQRWCRGLDPRISKAAWSASDDEKLQALVGAYGEKSWTRIAAELGNRSDVQCRYRFNQLRHARSVRPSETIAKARPAKTVLPSINQLIARTDSAPAQVEPSPNDLGLLCMMALSLGKNVHGK